MSIHTEKDDLKMARSLLDLPYQKTSKPDLGDDFEVEMVKADIPGVASNEYEPGTRIVRKKYYVSLAMGESPFTDMMVKDRSILYKWTKHPVFNVGDGSLRIDGTQLFPKKILINYDRCMVEMDFEMYDIIESGRHRGYITKPAGASMRFEHAYVQSGYEIKKITE